MSKLALFVDVQNIYYTTRQAYGRQFNYRKFWQLLEAQGDIVSATAYAIESQLDSQRKFQDALRHIGFEVKLKPYIQRSDGSAKGDWDVGITLDVLETAMTRPQVADKVILLSGDGDFDLLLEKVKAYGLNNEVYGVPSLTAKSLRDATDRFNPIEDYLLL